MTDSSTVTVTVTTTDGVSTEHVYQIDPSTKEECRKVMEPVIAQTREALKGTKPYVLLIEPTVAYRADKIVRVQYKVPPEVASKDPIGFPVPS